MQASFIDNEKVDEDKKVRGKGWAIGEGVIALDWRILPILMSKHDFTMLDNVLCPT